MSRGGGGVAYEAREYKQAGYTDVRADRQADGLNRAKIARDFGSYDYGGSRRHSDGELSTTPCSGESQAKTSQYEVSMGITHSNPTEKGFEVRLDKISDNAGINNADNQQNNRR